MEFRSLNRADLNDNFGILTKAMSGDMVFSLSQTTAAPAASVLAAGDVVYKIKVRLETAAGELHSWFNGKISVAIADDDATGAATVTPTGETAMTNGELEVTVTLPKAVWTAGKKATLTIGDVSTAGTGILGWAVADKTFVATVANS